MHAVLFGHGDVLLVLDALLKLVLIAIVAGCFVVLGLVFGGLLLPLFKRAGHLFWSLPLLNFAVYLLVAPQISFLWKQPMSLADHFRAPQSNLTVLALLSATLLGWVSAAMLAAFLGVAKKLDASGQPSTIRQGTAWQDYVNAPPAISFWEAFREGFSAPRYGWAYLMDHRRLWWYALIPILLNLVITSLALLVFLALVVGAMFCLHPLFPAGWGWLVIEILGGLGLLVLAVAAALATWLLLQGILCGHFYGKLARQVELSLGTPAESLKDLALGQQVVDTLLDVGSLIGVNVGLLALHVIPVLGSIAGLLGTLWFDCLLFGREYFEYPLGLRGSRRREIVAFTRQHRSQTLGLGVAAFVANLLPVVGAVVLSTAVVGGVLLHRRLAVADAGEA
jgi:CysZ protein